MVLVRKVHSYTNKDKEEKKGVNYYLVINGNWISIKPSFVSDYKKLQIISTDYNDYMSQNQEEF